ncbi:N-acetyltransferase [Candidatus Poribacteria bacterium]|nr:N-acetyltransferase [Candidatus Poribacteria bacterium]
MKNDFFIHESALVESDSIGRNTKIWAFAHVLKGSVIGENCNIGDHCFIESNVKIDNNVVIKNGTSIWNGTVIKDSVFIGPNVAFINDRYPRSKIYRDEYISSIIEKGASIGANATLLGGIKIGEYAMIGAGSVVTKDVPAYTLVYGNPARIRGYVCKCGEKLMITESEAHCKCGAVYLYINGRVTPKECNAP